MKQNQSAKCKNGIPVAPDALAADSVIAMLSAGENATEATVTAAATIDVVYPHMNGIDGMGVTDDSGTAVSFQHIYHTFSSADILPKSRIVWQNRERCFSLDPYVTNPLQPGRLPFHTLTPGVAYLTSGNVLAYGSRRGDRHDQHWPQFLPKYAIKKWLRMQPFPLHAGCRAEPGERTATASRFKAT